MKKIVFFVLFCFCIINITSLFWHSDMSSKEVIYQKDRYRISVDGVEVSTFPRDGKYYLAEYDCSNKNTVVTWDRDENILSVSNEGKKGGVSCYLNFETTPRLSSMKKGSYVKYSSSNGCVGDKCSGNNASYGYCSNTSSSFDNSGFRIAYVDDGSAYLVSAGVVECVCTSKDGSVSSNCGNYVDSTHLSFHFDNLDKIALKYCNLSYVYGGVCDVNTVRSINGSDFDFILNKGMRIGSCYDMQNKKCGYVDDLIDIGSDYWYSVSYDGLSENVLYWSSRMRSINSSNSGSSYGVRPVIRMDRNVVVTSGSGTKNDPYIIDNRTVLIRSFSDEMDTVDLELIGKDIFKMCINLNSTVCTNYVDFDKKYTLDIKNARDGKNVIYVYYKDNNDKVISVINREFSLEK